MTYDFERLQKVVNSLYDIIKEIDEIILQEILEKTYHRGFNMDKKIAKIQKENKKEGKDLASLKKMDKKQDKKIEKCDMKMMKKKKK